MKYTFPTETYGQDCVLVPIDRALIPIVSGALNKLLEQYVWKTYVDYQLGYNAISEVLAAMANNCLQELTESNNRLYRLWDTALNGTQYEKVGDEITPPIADVPPASTTEGNAIRAHLGRLWTLAENAHTGSTFAAGAGIEGAPALPADLSWAARLLAVQGETGGFFGFGAEPVTLASLLQAGRVNTPTDEGLIANGIEEIVGVVGSGGSIASALTNLLGTAADAATDGGLAAVQIASIVANAAAAGALAGQVGRLVAALDGGGLLSPADNNNNVLTLLRGGLLDSEELGAAERLREIGIDAARISERIGEETAGLNLNEQLNAIRLAQTNLTAILDLLSQVYPLAEGNDIYSALIAIGDRTRHTAEILSQTYPLAEGNDIYSTLIAINDNTRRSADCCEENSGGGGEPGLNPDPVPSGSCDWPATLYRVSSWTEVADVDDGNGGDLQTMWSATIDWSGEPFVADNSVVNNRRVYRLFSGTGQGWDVCYYWNFDGQQAPRQIGFDVGDTAADASNGTYTVPPDQTISGDASFDIPGDEFGDAQKYVSFNCQFERGVVPARNAWVKIRLTPLS